MSQAERAALAANSSGAPVSIQGDFPEWLSPHFIRAFGEKAAEEGGAPAAPPSARLRETRAAYKHYAALEQAPVNRRR